MEYTVITLKLLDVAAKSDGTPTSTNIQSFASAAQLKRDDVSVPKYATLEDDFFLLDGSFEPFPNSSSGMDFGYWSLSQSDSSGAFTVPPKLAVNFTQKHTSAGLTFPFQEDYPDQFTVRWYTLAGILITTAIFAPNNLYYFADNSVENYGKIEIEFNHTSKPYRYVKLSDIKYGAIVDFVDDAVTDANIIEEVNPVSSEISINTSSFSLHSETGEFDIINPQGMFKLFQQSQEVVFKQVTDTGIIQMGTHFLDTWKSSDANNGNFTAHDSVGKIDKTNFKTGRIYADEPAGNIIDEIMDSAGWTKYQVSEELRNIPLSGWIPICTHRAALQQVAFALGAIVDDSRSDTIKIYKGIQSYGHLISRSRKFSGGSTSLLSYVSDVNLTVHKFGLNSDAEQIYSGTLEVGTHEIHFDSAVSQLTITGATITEQHPNYAIITVNAAGDVVLSGKKYTDSTIIFNYGIETLPAGATRNPISVTGATLISSTNAASIALNLFNYYQLRYSTGTEIVLEQEKAGEKIALQRQNGTSYTMDTIEKMAIDLTDGFTAQITTLSNGIDIVMAYYAGELYAGQNMGVM